MKHLLRKIDVAYLPDCVHCEDPLDFIDSLDTQELTNAYLFCKEHKTRSFCTYPDLVKHIWTDNLNFQTKIAQVIDFPYGKNRVEQKILECGSAIEIGKVASSSELDIVLHPELHYAQWDITHIQSSEVYKYIGIKYILEIGARPIEDVLQLIQTCNRYEDEIKYIKTNTGKINKMKFKEKYDIVKRMNEESEIPIKVSGGVSSFDEIEKYLEINENMIFGVSYGKIKEWLT